MLFQVQVGDQLFERAAQIAFAEDDEARVGHFAHDLRRRLDEIAMPLVADERANRAGERGVVGEPVGLVHADRRRGGDVREIDPFVHGDGARRLDALFDQHLADRVGRAEERAHLAILPARERVVAQVEIDAPRGDEDRMRIERLIRERERRHGDAVRIVRVDDAWAARRE